MSLRPYERAPQRKETAEEFRGNALELVDNVFDEAGDAAAMAAGVAAVALSFFDFGPRLGPAIGGEGAAHADFLFEFALFVAADVALIARVGLDQGALAGLARGFPAGPLGGGLFHAALFSTGGFRALLFAAAGFSGGHGY
ncbi:MAG: hypothetical protein ACR2NX_11990 [Chthoniobacterales bacterium]